MLKTRLFFISYFPLFLIFALQLWPSEIRGWVSLLPTAVVLVLALYALGDALNLIAAAKKTSSLRIHIKNVNDEGGNVSGYLVTYIFPFVLTYLQSWKDWAAVGVYCVTLYVIFVRSNFGLVNPTLYLLGWRVVSADLVTSGDFGSSTKRETLVTKRALEPGLVRVKKMVGGYLIIEE